MILSYELLCIICEILLSGSSTTWQIMHAIYFPEKHFASTLKQTEGQCRPPVLQYSSETVREPFIQDKQNVEDVAEEVASRGKRHRRSRTDLSAYSTPTRLHAS
jgi:hypothetical protein